MISYVRLLHFGQTSPVALVKDANFSFSAVFSETKSATFIFDSANSKLRSARRFLNSASPIFLPISLKRVANEIAVDTEDNISDIVNFLINI